MTTEAVAAAYYVSLYSGRKVLSNLDAASLYHNWSKSQQLARDRDESASFPFCPTWTRCTILSPLALSLSSSTRLEPARIRWRRLKMQITSMFYIQLFNPTDCSFLFDQPLLMYDMHGHYTDSL